MIDRTTALCGAEYEWGVHVTTFAKAAEFADEQIASLTSGSADDACWDESEAALIRMCDALHRDATLGDDDWQALRRTHSEELSSRASHARRLLSHDGYLVNSLRLANEPGMAASRTASVWATSPERRLGGPREWRITRMFAASHRRLWRC